MTYKQGDLVQLKSGGPTMTFFRYLDSDQTSNDDKPIRDGYTLLCKWYDEKIKNYKTEPFTEELITPVSK